MSTTPAATTSDHDWLEGVKQAAVTGFPSFIIGAGVQALVVSANTLPTIAPYIAAVSLIFGVGFGFAKGANVA